MRRVAIVAALALSLTLMTIGSASGQAPPNLSGIWRLDPAESRMIGGPLVDREIRWFIDHRDPEIAVTVDVRTPGATHEFAFRCTTDGRECINELPEIQEVRRSTASWQGDVLAMTTEAQSSHGPFQATDRIYLRDGGRTLVFERSVRGRGRGERAVRQVFRRVESGGATVRDVADRLPSVPLPADLDRVLRDYERAWEAGDAPALAELFTDDGFVASPAGWVRGREAIRARYEGVGSPLRLRAVAYAAGDTVGYIIGAYGYGDAAADRDSGKFVLSLRRAPGGPWLIAADLDASNRP